MTAPLVSLSGLTVDFDQGARHVRALHGIDLTVRRGEAVGLVGESGCGKSITWLAALRLLGPRARVGGRVELDRQNLLDLPETELSRVRGSRIAMIFQDPASSLNPVHRIGAQIGEALTLHKGLTGEAARAEAKRLIDRVRIPAAATRLDAYPHELSGGMNQRVMIAMALAGDPDLLVADEPTTALDATIQAQILDLIDEIRRDTGMALVLISHDLGVVADLCDRVVVMYAGRIVEEAPVDALFDEPGHPYTRGLLAALPDLDGPRRRLTAIPGTVPAPGRLPHGCAFAPRCAFAEAGCSERVPVLAGAGDHRIACPVEIAVPAEPVAEPLPERVLVPA
ncbi:ABC transporter ATP-binding protein [Phreatobacter stygius]|uniref:ABC transporter ATP-binding protein n=1 Tax=Phreatobacter stygius TaxID=1940610 RepID=A0A4D7B670_9HYPH|nr:ABC transporter ATP-binding protein [Phreatobacter stygius]QCI65868.1 ABC transporter ATP-binding protein [Phreatobacter stygius]